MNSFYRTYLVTTVSTEIESLREEQERREEDEAEQELPWEKIQRRQPLADLSKKTTGIYFIFLFLQRVLLR